MSGSMVGWLHSISRQLSPTRPTSHQFVLAPILVSRRPQEMSRILDDGDLPVPSLIRPRGTIFDGRFLIHTFIVGETGS